MNGLLVGASGLVGANLLAAESAIDWTPAYYTAAPAYPRAIRVNLADARSVSEAVDQTAPDVIVCAGGVTKPDVCEADPDHSYRVNVLGAAHLARSAARRGARLIFLSSDLVFDGKHATPYRETDATSPICVYGHHKAEAERRIAEETGNYLVVRSSLLYGWPPPGVFNLASWILGRLQANQDAPTFAVEARHLTYVGDMAAFLLIAASSTATGIVHLAARECRSKLDLALAIAAAYGLRQDLVVVVPPASARRAAVPERIVLDVSRLAETFGFAAAPIAAGVAAFRDQGQAGLPARFERWWPSGRASA